MSLILEHGKTMLASVLLASSACCLDPAAIDEPAAAYAEPVKGSVTVACSGKAFRLGETQDCLEGTEWVPMERAKPQGKVFVADITGYSRKDSCHNPKWVDGKRLCLTAIGRDTTEGVTVACPRWLKLGTRVEINGHAYVCEDRTSEWVQKKFGTTFDVFTESYEAAVKAGRNKAVVTVFD